MGGGGSGLWGHGRALITRGVLPDDAYIYASYITRALLIVCCVYIGWVVLVLLCTLHIHAGRSVSKHANYLYIYIQPDYVYLHSTLNWLLNGGHVVGIGALARADDIDHLIHVPSVYQSPFNSLV